jgi:hypothetical protein
MKEKVIVGGEICYQWQQDFSGKVASSSGRDRWLVAARNCQSSPSVFGLSLPSA